MAKKTETHYVGIDLGTTFSSICELNGKNIYTLFRSELNEDSIPSIVSFSQSKCFVGTNAISNASGGNIIFEVKRFMGKRYNDIDEKLQELIKKTPNKVVPVGDGFIGVEIERPPRKGMMRETIQLLPEQVSALILMKLKDFFLKQYPNSHIKAVVGVPAAFGDYERKATERAMKIAGIEVIKMVNEPTAAAKAYDMNNGNLYVFDFGGGTLDISIVTFKDGEMQVKKSVGDPFLGGNNIDYNIMKYLIEQIKEMAEAVGIDESEVEKAIEKKKGKIKAAAENLKKALSAKYNEDRERAKAEIDLDFLGIEELEGEIDLDYQKFLELNKDIFDDCKKWMKLALSQSRIPKEKITKVLMSGGSCKCPAIKSMLIDHFGSEKVDQTNTDFDLLVCKGCACFAQANTGDLSSVGDGEICSKTISVGIFDQVTQKRVLEPVIKSGTPIPCEVKRVFVTTTDYQTNIKLVVFEEEKILTELGIYPLPTMLAGFVEVEITFSIGGDGKLYVSSKVIKPNNISLEKQCEAVPERKNLTEEDLMKAAAVIRSLYRGV